MTIATTTVRLAAMYQLLLDNTAGITPNVKRAFPYIPRILSPAQLPAVVIEPGEASYEIAPQGFDMVMETRIYRAHFYFDLALFGTETQLESMLLPLIDSIIDYFLQRPGLELDGADEPQIVVFDSTLLRDGGFTQKEYPTGNSTSSIFGGFTFYHQVRELRRNAFKD